MYQLEGAAYAMNFAGDVSKYADLPYKNDSARYILIIGADYWLDLQAGFEHKINLAV